MWFSLGCAADRVADYETAARAFRRKVEMDSEDFEAWNNLASAYVNLGQKPRAFWSLQEAVKASYENWRVWDNLALVSTDVGAFGEAIRAIQRVLDLRGKFADAHLLRVLALATTDAECPDHQGEPADKYKEAMAALVKRLKGAGISDYKCWAACAEFHARSGELDLAHQCRMSAYQAARSATAWERDDAAGAAVVASAMEVGAASIALHERKALASARLMLRSVLKNIQQAAEKGHDSEAKTEFIAKLEGALAEVQAALDAAAAAAAAE